MMEQKLTGELDEHTVGKTLRYYSEYIDSEMRKGKTEQEVLEDLGSPLLIARTILDTQGNGTANFSQTRPEGEAKEEEKGTESHRWNKWLFASVPSGSSVFTVYDLESFTSDLAAGTSGAFRDQPF